MSIFSILANPYFVFPTIALIIQIVVLALLIYGYYLFKRLNFPRHGKIMAWALVLHLIVIFSVMVPSLIWAVIPEFILRNIRAIIPIVTLIHVPLGITSASLGTWFVIAWVLKGLKGCFNRRRLMLLTFTLWIVTLVFGFIIYLIFYLPVFLTGHF